MKMYRLAVVAAAGLGLTLAPSAQAAPSITTVASGLDSPRGLDFAPNGDLYVAEAGKGGPGPCMTGGEGGTVCWGTTGAVTRVSHGHQQRVLQNLPSIAGEDGSSAIGPSDVSLHGTGNLSFTVGLGADPAVRARLPQAGQDGNGWLLRSTAAHRGWNQVADIAGYEAANNPDGFVPDSNPNAVLAEGDDEVVADAGGNDLLRVDKQGHVTTLAVFPDRNVPAPPFLGLPPGATVPAQAVPTSVVRGPDGAYYVGQLTGFPFAPGQARVYRVVPGQTPTVVASGFTNIIDIGFDEQHRLYVLEIAHGGLLSADTDPRGALTRVDQDGSKHLLLHDELTMPGGLAIHNHSAYISNCSVCAGGGSVLRAPLS